MKLNEITNNQIIELIGKGKKFVCFGAGNQLKSICRETNLEKHIAFLTDNNSELWGTTFKIIDDEICLTDPSEYVYDKNHILLISTTYHMQVYAQIQNCHEWNMHVKAYYRPSAEDKNFHQFYRFIKHFKIQKKLAFRSGMGTYVPGFDFSDNAKALYDYLIQEGYNNEYRLVWFVHDPSEFLELKSIKGVSLVSYEWGKYGSFLQKFRYFYHLLTSRYIFFTDSHFWLRYCRKGQIRVNLWHGCGFKDRKSKNGPTGQNYDYMTVTSTMYANIHAREFGCDRDKIIDTGLAKEDLLFKKSGKNLSELLGIAKATKYIFWTPTFRMATEGLERINEYELEYETGLPIVHTLDEANRLNDILDQLDAFLVIKLHPVQRNSLISQMNLSRITVLTNEAISSIGLQVNDLLAQADAMISDYSSVAVDYMLLDRPIAFMLEDEDKYANSRGFIFDNIHDYLPGVEIYNFDELCNFIHDVCSNHDISREKRRELLNIMHSHQDGNSCKRITEAIGLDRGK